MKIKFTTKSVCKTPFAARGSVGREFGEEFQKKTENKKTIFVCYKLSELKAQEAKGEREADTQARTRDKSSFSQEAKGKGGASFKKTEKKY